MNKYYINNCFRFLIFLIVQNNENTGYQYDITFIFDRRHHSYAAETPEKY